MHHSIDSLRSVVSLACLAARQDCSSWLSLSMTPAYSNHGSITAYRILQTTGRNPVLRNHLVLFVGSYLRTLVMPTWGWAGTLPRTIQNLGSIVVVATDVMELKSWCCCRYCRYSSLYQHLTGKAKKMRVAYYSFTRSFVAGHPGRIDQEHQGQRTYCLVGIGISYTCLTITACWRRCCLRAMRVMLPWQVTHSFRLQEESIETELLHCQASSWKRMHWVVIVRLLEIRQNHLV